MRKGSAKCQRYGEVKHGVGGPRTVTSACSAQNSARRADAGTSPGGTGTSPDRSPAWSGTTRGLAVDLSRPETIATALVDVEEVDNLVISAIEQGVNSLADFDIAEAIMVIGAAFILAVYLIGASGS